MMKIFTIFGLLPFLVCVRSIDYDGGRAVGTESFETIRFSKYFIDKTMLIQEIAKSANKVSLITYPPRWGKTINVDMLLKFFGLTKDKSKIDLLFKGTNIDKNRETCQKAWSMYGKHPIVYVDFRFVETDNYMKFLKSVKSEIAITFGRHKSVEELLQSKTDAADLAKFKEYSQKNFPEKDSEMLSLEKYEEELSDKWQEIEIEKTTSFRLYFNYSTELLQKLRQETRLPNITEEEADKRRKSIKGMYSYVMKSSKSRLDAVNRASKENRQKMDKVRGQIANITQNLPLKFEEYLEESLHFLTCLLKRVYNTKVIVLIDEYDQAITTILSEGGGEILDKVVKLIGRLLMSKVFKNKGDSEDAVEFGVITGVLRVAMARDFTGLNGLVAFNLIQNNFYKYYGFTESEIDHLVHTVPTNLTKNSLKRNFDGYRVSDDMGLAIYGPWSIVNSLCHNWIDYAVTKSRDTGTLKSIFLLPEVHPTILNLVSGGVERVQLNGLQFEVDDLKSLSRTIHKGVYNGGNLVLRLLFSTGYLSLANSTGNLDKFWIRIANKEMRSQLANILVECYEKIYGIPYEVLNRASVALRYIFGHEDTGEFKAAFFEVLKKFKKLTDRKDSGGVYYNEHFLRDLMTVVVFHAVADVRLSLFDFAGPELQQKMRPNCMFQKDSGTVLIIETKTEVSPDEGISSPEAKYSPIFEKFDYVKVVQYLGVTCPMNKKSKKIKCDIHTKIIKEKNKE